MFDAIRERLAGRRALKLVRRRQPRPWHPDPTRRRVLLVLPVEEEAAHEAWRFIDTLSLDASRLLPVVPAGVVTYAPASYIGRIRMLEAKDVDRLGLPKKTFYEVVWAFEPDVALCLASPSDRAAAVLVGASPAAFRAGFFAEEAEPFFDLMVSDEGGVRGGLDRLGRALNQVVPPVFG